MTDPTLERLYICDACTKMVAGKAEIVDGRIFHPGCEKLRVRLKRYRVLRTSTSAMDVDASSEFAALSVAEHYPDHPFWGENCEHTHEVTEL